MTNRIQRKNDKLQTQTLWRLRNQSDMRERVHRIEVKMLENFRRKARNLSSKKLVERMGPGFYIRKKGASQSALNYSMQDE